MKYAVVKFSGSQFLVAEGDQITVNRLPQKEGEKLKISEVLLLVDEEKVKIGKPVVKDVYVDAKIANHFQGEKVRVAKFKAKTGYRKVTGFRPQLTNLVIDKIVS